MIGFTEIQHEEDASKNTDAIEEVHRYTGAIMTIATTEYKGHELRAYFQQTLPLYRDPYAPGPHRYSSVVRIDTIPPGEGTGRRYQTQFDGDEPTQSADAVELAMQYARDIIDGKVNAQAL